MKPKTISRELRSGRSPTLSRRRGIIGLSMIAAGSMGMISLYQAGIIPHLPEPKLPRMNADKVDASPEAYRKLHTPDAFLGLASYGVTATLAAMEGDDRARTRPWIPIALTAKLSFDTLQAAKLTWDQWTRHRAFCFWCLAASAATFASLPLSFRETRKALLSLRKKKFSPR